MSEVTPVAVGDVVRVVDETYGEHNALVTCVHGSGPAAWTTFTPCINVLFLSNDENKGDSYGRQTERLSSLQHKSQVNMPGRTPGRYWENV